MRAREWEHVVRALQHLGCVKYHDTTHFVYVARGASIFQTVPKRPLSIALQQHLISRLGFSEAELERALELTRD